MKEPLLPPPWARARSEPIARASSATAVIASALLLLGVAAASHGSSHPLAADYDALLEWQFSDPPVAVPAEGLTWTVDTAIWELSSGRLWLQRPTADGTITGFVFEGSGRFRMTIPDPVELRQLRRLTGEPELESIDEPFDALVARGVGGPPFANLPQQASGTFRGQQMAADRHDHWLRIRRHDADARVVAALARDQDRYLRFDVRTDNWGWLTYDFDQRRHEEIQLERFSREQAFLESWLSLDRADDREAGGHPGSTRRPAVDILRVDVTADLSHPARESEKGLAKIRPVDAELEVILEMEGLIDGEGALQLYLLPSAEVGSVIDGDGHELAFLRDHVGRRSSGIDQDLFDDSLVVLLENPLDRGELLTLTVAYELEVTGFAPGRFWYPAGEHPREGLADLHTARLELAARQDHALRAMGVRQGAGDRDSPNGVWIVDEPVKMITFALAKRSHEEVFARARSPEVAAFSSLDGYLSRGRLREAGRHVTRSLDFFERLLDAPLPGRRLQTVLIPAAHGQAFEGFLHLPDYTTAIDRVAVQELFRAHEVAHQWWGHRVGWDGYRHQWLSEALAEYSAMMFVEAEVEGGERYFQEMLKAFRDEITGSLKSTFSQFTRPGYQLLEKRARDRVGPVGHGYRCAVGEAPGAWLTLAYKKGAMVLHSLRMSSRALTGSDEAFIDILRSFLRRHQGSQATTEDLVATVEEHLPGSWDWFFDQWIYGAEIPTYVWSWEADRDAAGGPLLRLSIEQREVTPPFRISVPVRVTFADGEEALLLARAEGPRAEIELALAAPPVEVDFNPDQAVLARVKRARGR